MLKNKFGITLIALVITIVVLVILAGVGINLSMGENGILGKAQNAVDKYKQASQNEQIELAKYEDIISGYRNIDKTELTKLLKEIIKEEHIDTTPVGTVISQMGNTAPIGYLVCDGQWYDINGEYKYLAAYILEQFGSYDYFKAETETTQSNKFKVPDLRGEFLRGTGTNAHVNQGDGALVGAHQDGTVHWVLYANKTNGAGAGWSIPAGLNHEGDWYGSDSPGCYPDSVIFNRVGTVNYVKNGNSNYGFISNLSSASTSIDSGFTSRSTNTSVLYCIKY